MKGGVVFCFILVLITVAPHMILEAFAYIAAATTGGVVSKAIVREKLLSKRFNFIMINTIISLAFALFVLVIAIAVETYVLGNATLYRTIIQQSFI